MCVLSITRLLRGVGRWARKPVNHTSWVAVVNPTDHPKSVRNRCFIELFCVVVCVVTLPFWHFCWCRGFCHSTGSDLLLFVSIHISTTWWMSLLVDQEVPDGTCSQVLRSTSVAELVRRGKKLDVDKLKQEISRRDSHAVCNETHIAKWNRINLVERPKSCHKPHKQWFRGKNVIILEWPSYSTDFDPIENVWRSMHQGWDQSELVKEHWKKWWEKWCHIGTVRNSNLT